MGTSKRNQWAEAQVFASQRAASESKSLKLKAFVVHFKWLDLGPPMGGCPNQIVLVGPMYFGTYQIYSVIFHVMNNKSLILM